DQDCACLTPDRFSRIFAPEEKGRKRAFKILILRELQFLEIGVQSQDHPIHPAIPETAYLKTLVARVLAR
ncbi:MAG: hypothetical protein MN733_20655, partial [Nitrososphaera sp.]|nr:hypothetical protein [Nitrososphaera sp.]